MALIFEVRSNVKAAIIQLVDEGKSCILIGYATSPREAKFAVFPLVLFPNN